MFAFFDGVVQLIFIVCSFVIKALYMLISVIGFVLRAVSWLILCLAYLPPWLTAFLIVPISLSVLFQIINKGD